MRPAPHSVSLVGDDILAGQAFRYRFAFSIGVEAFQAAGADPDAASFQHHPGSQSVQQSGHSALGTYECAVPGRSAPWAAPLRASPPSRESRHAPVCTAVCALQHHPLSLGHRVQSCQSGVGEIGLNLLQNQAYPGTSYLPAVVSTVLRKEGRSIEVTAIEGLLKLFGNRSIRFASGQGSVSLPGRS